MTMLGADPDQLESTAQRVLALADNYENANQQIGYWMRRMAWEGAEAERFHATYQSQMHPQLMAAAAFLRQASSELRAHAADQIRASRNEDAASWICGIARLPQGGLGVPGFDGIGDRLKDIGEFGKGILDLDTFVSSTHYMTQHYTRLPGLGGWTPYMVDKVDDLAGLDKIVGKHGARILGPVGIGISLWSLTKDVPELFDDFGDLDDAITRGDRGDTLEALEQIGYSYSDVAMGVGGIILGASAFAGPAAPVVAAIGAGVLAGGALIQVGAFAFDHLRDPVAEGLKGLQNFAQERVSEIKDVLSEELRPIAEELAEAGSEIGREVREGLQSIRRQADGLIETGAETFEAVTETGREVAEGAAETFGEGVKKVWNFTKRGSRGLGLLNSFPW